MPVLSQPEQRLLRASYQVTNLLQAVEQLMYSSIYAGSVCIAVRIKPTAKRIEVIDNGRGLQIKLPEDSESCLPLQSNAASTISVFELNGCSNILNLATLSEKLVIKNKLTGYSGTTLTIWKRGVFQGHSFAGADQERPSAGTSVIIKNLFYNNAVRNSSCFADDECCRVIDYMKSVAVIFYNISLSYRDEDSGSVHLNSYRVSTLPESFSALFGRMYQHSLHEMRTKSKHFSVKCFIGKAPFSTSCLQFVSVNGRLFQRSVLHRFMNNAFGRSLTFCKERRKSSVTSFPVFVICLLCDPSEIEVCNSGDQTLLHCENLNELSSLLSGAVNDWLVQEGFLSTVTHNNKRCVAADASKSTSLFELDETEIVGMIESNVCCIPTSPFPVAPLPEQRTETSSACGELNEQLLTSGELSEELNASPDRIIKYSPCLSFLYDGDGDDESTPEVATFKVNGFKETLLDHCISALSAKPKYHSKMSNSATVRIHSPPKSFSPDLIVSSTTSTRQRRKRKLLYEEQSPYFNTSLARSSDLLALHRLETDVVPTNADAILAGSSFALNSESCKPPKRLRFNPFDTFYIYSPVASPIDISDRIYPSDDELYVCSPRLMWSSSFLFTIAHADSDSNSEPLEYSSPLPAQPVEEDPLQNLTLHHFSDEISEVVSPALHSSVTNTSCAVSAGSSGSKTRSKRTFSVCSGGYPVHTTGSSKNDHQAYSPMNLLQSLASLSTPRYVNRKIVISRKHLEKAQVVAQFDGKFIVCKSKEDAKRHGEKRIASGLLREGTALIELPESDIRVISCNLEKLELLGVSAKVSGRNAVTVKTAPICLLEKEAHDMKVGRLSRLNFDLRCLLVEFAEMSREAPCVNALVPKYVQDVMNLQACKEAIKFGQKLSLEQCERLLQKLRKCNAPFQCAHGRPTTVPLIELYE